MNVAMKKLPEDPLLLKKIILSLESEKESLTQKTEFLQEQNKLLLARLSLQKARWERLLDICPTNGAN
jgi:hypothetical protein